MYARQILSYTSRGPCLQDQPVLDRFFNDQTPRPDFRLSRESLKVLLDILGQDRRHGWGATIETLVFLFWLASGASCRVVSRVFGCLDPRVTEEVVAIRHQHPPPRTAEDLEAVSPCAVLHNICIGAGDIMAPEEDIVEDVAEDEGENVVLLGGTNCLQRCLPWRRFLVTTIMCKAVMALPQPDPRPPRPLGPPLLNLAVACRLE
ncbi:hypothetical protein F7725_017619 [Dissostichus mawsoni]|uniref:Uncharacterized protein n=1 Tax=Dissostichus mawsoni TaxID=36200 RepID=A0A7J5Z5J3_DISMA|nr:hypothetical protein F7725_017619 [Dissostichus mawsoni]